MVAQIAWTRVGKSLFITLTYPDECIGRTAEQRTMDRHRFLRDMENHLGKEIGVVWRVEWQARKSGKMKGTMVPHVHLIAFGCGFIHWKVIRKLWRAVLAVDGPLATDVQRIKGGRDVGKYVTKYCAKLPDKPSLDNASYLNTTGRHWGVHRKYLIPWSDRFVMKFLSPDEIKLCENAACMTFAYFTREVDQGFSLIGKLGKQVGEEILTRHIDKGWGFD